ncbi:hypothetical protein [Longispora fulva]|uniref:Uncharacterized protein n=1 Tax=Longispora fulva TaxID=619741 RepID=A0A8J7KW83_9ACTN|nr:hypothetical protein [Longispora fulva]MBG6136232.1 hypothetical protein [Longispora fulva]
MTMTTSVTVKLPSQMVAAARRWAERDGTNVSAMTGHALEELITRLEFAEHAEMLRAADAADPDRLRRRAAAMGRGLAAWKADRELGTDAE